jgi:hypothetical protein
MQYAARTAVSSGAPAARAPMDQANVIASAAVEAERIVDRFIASYRVVVFRE